MSDAMRVRAVVSGIILAMLLLAGIALVFVPIPEANRDQFNMLLGALSGGGLGTVLGYWLGSSQSSNGSGPGGQRGNPAE